MPRAPPGLSLLLMAALAFAATPPLEIINPWLSACDLQPASATDLKGACSAMWGPGPLCPPPCPPNSTHQCLLYLEDSHKETVCGHDFSPERRRRALKDLRMRHCCEHAVDLALPDKVFQGGETCRHLLDALLEVDALAARISCEFAEVLYRYDCSQKYSIKHQCEDCKEAYRKWVCSSMVPHYSPEGFRVRPCLNICQSVEQKCPYMLPGDRAPAHPTQYAGEPTFLCLDPNIPETGDQRAKSSVGDEDCCYTHCGTPGRGEAACGINVTCRRPPATAAVTNGTGRGAGTTAAGKSRPPGPSSSSTVDQVQPVNCSAGLGANSSCSRYSSSASPSAANGAPPRSPSRTLVNKVSPLWTAWILLTQINTVYSILQCLLVMCATCVRTSLTRIKTKWRPWS